MLARLPYLLQKYLEATINEKNPLPLRYLSSLILLL